MGGVPTSREGADSYRGPQRLLQRGRPRSCTTSGTAAALAAAAAAAAQLPLAHGAPPRLPRRGSRTAVTQLAGHCWSRLAHLLVSRALFRRRRRGHSCQGRSAGGQQRRWRSGHRHVFHLVAAGRHYCCHGRRHSRCDDDDSQQHTRCPRPAARVDQHSGAGVVGRLAAAGLHLNRLNGDMAQRLVWEAPALPRFPSLCCATECGVQHQQRRWS